MIVVNKCHEGFRPDHLEWLGVQTVIPSRPNHLLCCEDRPVRTDTRLSVRSSLRRGRELPASSARHFAAIHQTLQAGHALSHEEPRTFFAFAEKDNSTFPTTGSTTLFTI